MKLLEEKGKVNINRLAEEFQVTKVTIRSDIDSLETRGLLVRTHGGAVLPENHHRVRRITQTLQERRKEKEGIALVARTLIEPGSTVLIDSGSTTAILARNLKSMRLTVVTNSVLVLQELVGSETVKLLVCGGVLRKSDMALIGEIARSFYEQLNTDIVFLGANGYSVEKGISCANLIEAQTKQHMIKSAQKVCLLADSSKQNRVALAHVCDWEDIDILVTDSLSSADREALAGYGVEVKTIKTKEEGR
ncbi:MAG: DeoR/GlpR transcriptional regulator [Spirochaetaceae bacterium]|nr:MAG: DeoR/GlpR transcriptional regulator [Spirochaetaceae bacterium]